jgi:hypothetical protein
VRGQGGDGGERERSQGEGAKSKPGLRCNEFLFLGVTGRRPHQLATGGRRLKSLYLCHGRKAAVCSMNKSIKGEVKGVTQK